MQRQIGSGENGFQKYSWARVELYGSRLCECFSLLPPEDSNVTTIQQWFSPSAFAYRDFPRLPEPFQNIMHCWKTKLPRNLELKSTFLNLLLIVFDQILHVVVEETQPWVDATFIPNPGTLTCHQLICRLYTLSGRRYSYILSIFFIDSLSVAFFVSCWVCCCGKIWNLCRNTMKLISKDSEHNFFRGGFSLLDKSWMKLTYDRLSFSLRFSKFYNFYGNDVCTIHQFDQRTS